jgi:hypothetical protein
VGVVRETLARVDELAAADAALRNATAWTRPAAFLGHVDWGIARATWAIFRPAVPTTAEGLAYAVAGMVLALGFYHLCVRMPIARRIRLRGEARAAGPG